MLQKVKQSLSSDFENLYERLIPKTNFLRQFNDLVDFSFIYDALKGQLPTC